MKIAGRITDLIGNTPLLELSNLEKKYNLHAKLIVKVEAFNPLSSVKDRVGFAMVEAAEKSGDLKEGTVIIEPTSGNTGVGLAAVAASKGYRLILTMPETMSVERRSLLKALGAEIVLTDGKLGMMGKARGMAGAYVALFKLIEEQGGIDEAEPYLVGYTGSRAQATPFVRFVSQNLGLERPPVLPIGTVIGTHAGPGAAGIAFFAKEG